MRLLSLFYAFVASSLVAASPEIETILESLAEDEIHIFKRDTPVTARDIELAKRHNIDLNQMFKHSIVKRDDGDHVTIWVAHNYIEGDDEDPDEMDSTLEKRQKHKLQSTSKYSTTLDTDVGFCTPSGHWLSRGRTWHKGDTGPNAPFTGGANAIIKWGGSCKRGRWWFSGRDNRGDRLNLIVAGSNSGFNMRFTVEVPYMGQKQDESRIGCRDVGRMTQTARNAHQKNRNGMRLRAYGGFTCSFWSEACFKTLCSGLPGTIGFNWWIDNWTGKV